MDNIIITVANEEQKKYLEDYLYNYDNSLMSKYNFWIIISALGTGTALIDAYELKKKENINSHVLLINSGGKSSRTRLFSKKGKVFIPTPSKSNPNNIILNEIVDSYTLLKDKILDDGILIVAADTICENLNIKNDISGSCAISVETDKKYGQFHGVFKEENEVIIDFFHKESLATLESNNTINNNKLWIDTGIYFLNIETLDFIEKKYIDKYNEKKFIDFYGEIIPKYINDNKMNLIKSFNSTFIHLGNYDNYYKYLKKRGFEIKRNNKKIILYNSKIDEDVMVGDHVIIFNCNLKKGIIPDNSVVFEEDGKVIIDEF